jgi:hypothetical protein
MPEIPSQLYYPSARVVLIVRFEEGKDTPATTKQAPKKPTRLLKGVKDERAPLVATTTTDDAGREIYVLEASTPPKAAVGEQAGSTSTDKRSFALPGIIPRSADWIQNGVRTADELKLSIRWVDMPFDPRTMRACAVKFYLGTIDPSTFGEGMQSPQGAAPPNGGFPPTMVPSTYQDSAGKTRSNLRFEGWVDKWSMSWGDGEALVDLECRDNTQLVIDTKAPPALAIDIKIPLDKAIAQYLSHFPAMQGMRVVYKARDPKAKAPILKDVLANTAFNPKNGGPPVSGGGGGDDDLSVWDYITDLVGSIGHIVFIDGREIVLTTPTTVILGQDNSFHRPTDSYQGRNLGADGNYPVRAFIYGRNVKDLKVAREYSNKEPQNIEVRCYSPKRKKTLVARYPEKADRLIKALPGDGTSDAKWKVIKVQGIQDQETLKKIAEERFNLQGRNEIEVSVTTKNLASFGGGNADPDLLDMKSGDTFQLLINRETSHSATQTQYEKALSGKAPAANTLVEMGYQKDLAEAYAKAYGGESFQSFFKMKEMSTSWSIEEGVSFDIKGVNFVEARISKERAKVLTSETGT